MGARRAYGGNPPHALAPDPTEICGILVAGQASSALLSTALGPLKAGSWGFLVTFSAYLSKSSSSLIRASISAAALCGLDTIFDALIP